MKCNVKAFAMIIIILGGHYRTKTNYTEETNLKEFEKYYISILEKHERKSLFQFIEF